MDEALVRLLISGGYFPEADVMVDKLYKLEERTEGFRRRLSRSVADTEVFDTDKVLISNSR